MPSFLPREAASLVEQPEIVIFLTVDIRPIVMTVIQFFPERYGPAGGAFSIGNAAHFDHWYGVERIDRGAGELERARALPRDTEVLRGIKAAQHHLVLEALAGRVRLPSARNP